MNDRFGSRLDDHGFEIYEENPFPLGYLITFRTYGTWLHGDQRTSMQRVHDENDRSVCLAPNVPLEDRMFEELKQAPTVLSRNQRIVVEAAIRETCEFRSYGLPALNVRSNHAHVVVFSRRPAGPDRQ